MLAKLRDITCINVSPLNSFSINKTTLTYVHGSYQPWTQIAHPQKEQGMFQLQERRGDKTGGASVGTYKHDNSNNIIHWSSLASRISEETKMINEDT